MKTSLIRFHQVGGPEVLKWEEMELSAPGKGEVLIKHEAIGVNYIETYFRTGLYPTPFPATLGTEAAGVVLEIGPGVTYVRPGDRIAYATGPMGSYSEKRIIPERALVKLPDSISCEIAAAMMLKGLTVQYLFRQIYPVKAGETILFHAAAGGVGLIACQWARHLGVKLIGTVSSEEKAQLAKTNGAYATINYTHENIPEQVLAITGGSKLPVVYDSVGKSTWEASLDCIQPRGLMVSFGNASGPVTNVNIGILSQKGSLFLTRPTLYGYADTPEKLRSMAAELFSLVSSGAITINISKRFPLKEAGAAHEHVSGRTSTGSTILIP